MNKTMYLGVGVYVADVSCTSSTCVQSFYSARPLKHHATGMQ